MAGGELGDLLRFGKARIWERCTATATVALRERLMRADGSRDSPQTAELIRRPVFRRLEPHFGRTIRSLLRGGRPGEALAWYTLILMAGLVWGEWQGIIPFHRWQLDAFAALAFTMLTIAFCRSLRKVPKHLLLHPRHQREMAEMLRMVYDPRRHFLQPARVGCTSLGILISGDLVRKPGWRVFHYAISARNTPLSDSSARPLAELILRLKHPLSPAWELIRDTMAYSMCLSQSHEGRSPCRPHDGA